MSRKSKAAEFMNEGYTINVTGRNVAVTDSMKDYALDKVAKVEKFGLRIIEVIVVMDIQKLEHRVDIHTKVNDMKIKSSGFSDNMYASIDIAVDKLQEQLRRYKTRINDHHARHVDVENMIVNVLSRVEEDDLDIVNSEIEDENNRAIYEKFRPHQVVKKETCPVKTLRYEEASMKLDLSGDSFLIFRNEADKKVCVMYRRKDGDFGVIETD